MIAVVAPGGVSAREAAQAPGTVVPASGPDWSLYATTVRLPYGAEDWRTFSPTEREQAYAWVREQFEAARADGTLVVEAGGTSSTAGGASSRRPGSRSGVSTQAIGVSGHCGLMHSDFTYGTWTWAYASTETTAPVGTISTGMTGQADRFLRNGQQLQSGGTLRYNDPYVYWQSMQNFKWWFAGVTYAIQSYHTAQLSNGYYLWYNVYCYDSFNP